jgi:putative DNA primase/helicase
MNSHSQCHTADLPYLTNKGELVVFASARPSAKGYDNLPKELDSLVARPQWVAWKYALRDDKMTKLPIDPRTGSLAKVNSPDTWSSYTQALERATRDNLTGGVGYVLHGDFIGIDLDRVLEFADHKTEGGRVSFWDGKFTRSWVEQLIGLAETYVEISPSGKGLRLIATASDTLVDAIKNDDLGIEVYTTGRYLTITGRHIGRGAIPISRAPRTLALLQGLIAAHKATNHKAKTSPHQSHAKHSLFNNFFKNVNAAALNDLSSWVPTLFPTAKLQSTGAYRVTSRDLGRDFEEDLSIHPAGIQDFGPEEGKTPIDIVIEHGNAADAKQAAFWLCEKLGKRPESLGWSKGNTESTGNGKTDKDGKTNASVGGKLRIVRADTVKQQQVQWVWKNRLARGKSALLGGDPGEGKSQIGCDIIARITRGLPWPDGVGVAPLGSCIILSAEDAADDAICPRLTAAGADLSKVHIIDAVKNPDGSDRSVSLITDLPLLEDALRDIDDAVLVMIDPVTAYLGADLDSHRTTSVRSVLQPLERFAAKYGIVLLGITHPPKAAQTKAINAFTGSLAFIAAARTGFIVATELETGRKVFLPVKTNIGMKAEGLGYKIEGATTSEGIETSRIYWDGLPVTITANEAMQDSTPRAKGDARHDAEDFLNAYLENGPMPGAAVEDAAKANGISERTLRRARKSLAIIVEKAGFKEGWQWRLPD